MKKAKHNEIPKEYRRNYKKEFANNLAIIASASVIAIVILLLIFL